MRLAVLQTRLGRGALAVALILAGETAVPRPFTLDDLLALESLDQMEITPDGRHLVIQTEAAYDSARRFDADGDTPPLLGRLKVADLRPLGPARDLVAPVPGAGYVAGPISPSGRAMVVQRFQAGVWDTGVVDLATGQAHWLGLPTDDGVWGRSLQWRSETRLVVIALAPGDLPLHMRTIRQTTERLPELWRRAREGRVPTATLVGSGRALFAWPSPPPRRLVEIDLAGGAVRDLAEGAFFDLELSADGRYLAALATGEPEAPASGAPVRVGTPARRRSLTLVDLATGAVSGPLPGQDLLSQLLAWSPAGHRLLVFGRRIGEPADADGALLEVDAANGRVSTPAKDLVIPEVAYNEEGDGLVRADWLGRWPIVYGRRAGSAPGRTDWFHLAPGGPANLTAALAAPPPRISAITGSSLLLVADGAAWRVNAIGHARRLAEGGLRALAIPRFGRGVRFEVNAPPRQAWAWVASPTGLQRLADAGGPARIDLAGDERAAGVSGGAVAIRRRDDHGVQTVTVAEGRTRTAVLTVNPGLAAIDPLPARPIEHLGPDGRSLTSWLYMPPGLPPGARPPLIVLPYPGLTMTRPSGRYAPDALVFTPNARLLAAHGLAVLAPSLPRDLAAGEPAAGLADQVLAAVDAVIDQGLADPDRLALWGHSFGGYGALVTATQTTRFKAIIAQAASADLAAGWGALPVHFRAVPEDGPAVNLAAGWSEGGQGGLGAPPWADPDRYRRNSPFFAADRIETPLFLIQGDQDFVALAQGEAMFAALYRQGKDALLMTLPGEGHLPASPANVRAIYAQVLPWLDSQLGPGGIRPEPPAAPASGGARPPAR